MSADVEYQQLGTLLSTAVRSGDPVRAGTWSPVVRAVNHLNGRSRTLIPYHRLNVTLASGGGAESVSWRVFPSYQATHRLWLVQFVPGSGTLGMEFTDPSGGVSTFRGSARAAPYAHVETVTSRTTSESTLTVSVESVDGTQTLAAIACFELPRSQLVVNANDRGIDLATIDVEAPVYFDTGESLGGIVDALNAARSRGRRTLFQWASVADTSNSQAVNDAAYAAVFNYSSPLLERFLYSGETQVEIEVRINAWLPGGSSGDVRITMTNGDSASVNITATTPTWVSITGLSVDAEDLSASDGRRSTRSDLALIEARKNGAPTMYIAGIGIFGRAT